MKRATIYPVFWAVLLALALTGCGGVITPEPETEVPALPPTDTPSFHPPTATAPFHPTPATATPTVTPTPVVHVIQEGDTLAGIAAAYGVSVQALQAVNGIENPLLLPVGQELIIPTGEEEAASQPGLLLPTPTPLSFGLRGVGFYETPVGSLWCLGEVVNTTPYTLTNVQVQVTLFDPAGTPVVERDVFAAADVLFPSDRAPFGILFVSPPPNFASHRVTVLRGEFAGALADEYISLAVEEVSSVPSGPQFEVSGRIRNTDPARSAAGGVVIVTTYDSEGRVTGFRQQTVDVGEGLAPGAAVPFRLLFTAHGGTPADFSVVAFGRTYEEEMEPEG